MPESPEELYNGLNIYLLEGMPCDRVTRIIKSEDNILESAKNFLTYLTQINKTQILMVNIL